MPIKLVILDLDQTLTDTLKRFYTIFNKLLAKYGRPTVDWETFFMHYKFDTLDSLIGDGRERFWEEFSRSYCNQVHPEDRVINGAIPVLEELKRARLRLVVATGRMCSPEDVEAELEAYGLLKYFEAVYTVKMVDRDREHLWSRTSLLKRILSDFKVKPEEAVFVADYWIDMMSAKNVGVIGIAVKTGHEVVEKLEKAGAKLIIDGIWQLPLAIRKIESTLD